MVMAMISPAMASSTVTSDTALLEFDGSKQQCLEELSNCGQKVVDLSVKLEDEKVSNKDEVRDGVAIGVAVGAFVATGGLSAAAPVVGKLIALPFILLGF